MFLRICEGLGFNGVVQRSYDRKASRTYKYKGFEQEKRFARDWIKQYESEENRGIEILQCQRRLEEAAAEEKSVGAIWSDENEDQPVEESPNYISDQHSQQLETLREQYWIHRQQLAKIEAEKPRGPIINQWDMLRRCKTRQGLTLAWVRDSQACARGDGCCGRDCGCCDRPLKKFLMPTGDSRGKEKSGIYVIVPSSVPAVFDFGSFINRSRRLPTLEMGPED